MAAAINETLGFSPDLIRGSGGVYKIWAGERLIWDKSSTGRFPGEDEILDRLRALKGRRDS